MSYQIIASPVFKLSLQRLEFFLANKYGVSYASEIKSQLKKQITTILPSNPYVAPVSQRLLDVGVSSYRQWSIDKNNLLFYSIDENLHQVTLLAVIDQRQSISKLLYEINLLL